MCSKATSVFNCKRDQNMGAAVNNRNGLSGGGPVFQELAVLRLFRSIAKNKDCMPKDSVAIDGGHHNVDNQVTSLNEERSQGRQHPHVRYSHITAMSGTPYLSDTPYITAMSVTPTSFRIDSNISIRPTCIRCLILPLGHRTTRLSRDSVESVVSPHCEQ